jgi:hypothetical protein
MLKNAIIYLLIGIFTVACATLEEKKQGAATDTAAEAMKQRDPIHPDEFKSSDGVPSPDWRPFKGVLLRHIVANCCFSESQNTVILGQDNNGDQKVDRCYQLKGKEGEIYYRTLECPKDLAPVKTPQRKNLLQCNLN